MVKDATRDRHALVHTKDERLPPLHLELEPSLEHEKELVFVLVAVPVDELALDHGKSDDGVIHARERLIHPRLIPRALCGDVDLRKLTVLVVISDVVVLHTHLPVALDWLGETKRCVLPGSARRCSVDPGWVYEDAVAAVWAIGADGDQLEAVVSGFERPHRCGVDANDIPAAELADLVVESDLSGAADDDVGLLLFAVAMRRR